MRFLVINGPNLNLLGRREPEIYGSDTLADLDGQWRRHATRLGVGVSSFQSNHEGAIIDTIQSEGARADGIVLNAGALSHTSYAIYDALVAVGTPTVEVHISDIHRREAWRRTSVTAAAAMYSIVGRGTEGYVDALTYLWSRLSYPATTAAYGPEPDQVLDLRVPEGAHGVVLVLHGGFWRSIWSRDTSDRLAAALADAGWATANTEYRRGPDSFAAATSDVGAALAWLRSDGGLGAAATRPAVVGHSAGGYLAIRAAMDDDTLLGAVALGSVLDLDAVSAARPDDDPVTAFLGSPDASVRADAALDEPASMVHLVHGSNDEVIPVAQAEAFAAAHERVRLSVVEGADHMDVIDPSHAAFAEVTGALGALEG